MLFTLLRYLEAITCTVWQTQEVMIFVSLCVKLENYLAGKGCSPRPPFTSGQGPQKKISKEFKGRGNKKPKLEAGAKPENDVHV